MIARRKGRVVREKPAPDGKRVFAATIGVVRVLYDAENFDKIADVPDGVKPKVVATKLKRKLVKFVEASKYALCERARAWKAGFTESVEKSRRGS